MPMLRRLGCGRDLLKGDSGMDWHQWLQLDLLDHYKLEVVPAGIVRPFVMLISSSPGLGHTDSHRYCRSFASSFVFRGMRLNSD